MDEKILSKELILTKINAVGKKYLHIFAMDDGTFREVETTKEEYDKLSLFNPQNPTILGGVWKHSLERSRFDTPDGDMADSQYCDNAGGYMMKKGNYFLFTRKDEIVNDKIDEAVVNDAIQKVGIPELIITK